MCVTKIGFRGLRVLNAWLQNDRPTSTAASILEYGV